jgi:hypothetical protein
MDRVRRAARRDLETGSASNPLGTTQRVGWWRPGSR